MLRHLGDDQNFDLGNVEFEIFHRYFDGNTDPAVGCTFLYSSQRRFVMNIYIKKSKSQIYWFELKRSLNAWNMYKRRESRIGLLPAIYCRVDEFLPVDTINYHNEQSLHCPYP